MTFFTSNFDKKPKLFRFAKIEPLETICFPKNTSYPMSRGVKNVLALFWQLEKTELEHFQANKAICNNNIQGNPNFSTLYFFFISPT